MLSIMKNFRKLCKLDFLCKNLSSQFINKLNKWIQKVQFCGERLDGLIKVMGFVLDDDSYLIFSNSVPITHDDLQINFIQTSIFAW